MSPYSRKSTISLTALEKSNRKGKELFCFYAIFRMNNYFLFVQKKKKKKSYFQKVILSKDLYYIVVILYKSVY